MGLPRGGQLTIDWFAKKISTDALAAGDKMEVAGYPGDRGKLNYAWKQSGDVIRVIAREHGGIVMFYETHTTTGAGVSGAPLYFLHKDIVQANRGSKALGAA